VFPFGSIVLARFPFTDLSGDKRRPALVISGDNDRRPDLVVCFITSVRRSGPDMAAIAQRSYRGPLTVRVKLSLLRVRKFGARSGPQTRVDARHSNGGHRAPSSAIAASLIDRRSAGEAKYLSTRGNRRNWRLGAVNRIGDTRTVGLQRNLEWLSLSC